MYGPNTRSPNRYPASFIIDRFPLCFGGRKINKAFSPKGFVIVITLIFLSRFTQKT